MRLLLALLMAAVPATSLPVWGGALVKPLSVLPCAGLLLLALGRGWRWWRRAWGWDLMLLGAFFGWALAAGLVLASVSEPASFRGLTPVGCWLRASATLAMGCGFFLAVRLALRDPRDLEWAKMGLYAGLTVSVVVAALQVAAKTVAPWLGLVAWLPTIALTDGPYATGAEWVGRPVGLALEPSWFASQLATLYLPVALAHTVGVARDRPWHERLFTLDSAMVLVAVAGLLLSGSRAGLVGGLLVGAAAGWAMAGRWRWLVAPLGLAAAGAAVALAALTIPYVARTADAVWQAATGRVQGGEILIRLNAEERVACWHTGLRAWAGQPVVGIGLGQLGQRFPEFWPEWAEDSPARSANCTGAGGAPPNAKCMPARLLAETGLAGTVLFLAFVGVAMLRGLRCRDAGRVLAPMAMVALIADGMSLDSFALPTAWLLLAWMVCLGRLPDGNLPRNVCR